MLPTRTRRLLPAATPIVLAGLLLAACHGSGPGERTVLDLAAGLPLAEARREVAVIELAAPAAYPHLVAGWAGAVGESARWGTGARSSLRFDLLAARDFPLVLRGSPLEAPGLPEQSVTVAVNGRAVGSLALPPRVGEVGLVLPAAALSAGENRLELSYAWSRSPAELGLGQDQRRLAVAWREARFPRALPAAGEPRAEGDALFLPTGVQLDWHLALPADSALELPAVSWNGAQAARLEVQLQPELGAERTVAAWSRGEVPRRLELQAGAPGLAASRDAGRGGPLPAAGEGPGEGDPADGGDGLVRLSLRLWSPQPAASGEGVTLRGARVVAPPATSAEPTSADGPPLEPPLSDPAPDRNTPGPGSTGSGTTVPAIPDSAALPGRRPNVLIYLVDTLRADHLGCYGYDRPVSPRLDAFAAEGVLFERSYAQSSWTRSSTASILTGLWPPAHGANRRRDRLGEEAVTLAELLAGAGYRTAAVVANPNVSRTFGFGQGFEEFRFLRRRNGSHLLNRDALAWLDSLEGGAPFFLYVHTVDPHDPYDPPPAQRARFAPGESAAWAAATGRLLKELRRGDAAATPEVIARLTDLYDGEIAANDHQFGLLLDALEERGLGDGTLVIFLSDHGEEFFEHGGWTHGHTLLAELVDTPLVMRLPGGAAAGRRVAAPVQHIDVLPTVLEVAGVPVPPGLEGHSLVPLALGRPWAERSIYTYLELDQVGRADGPLNRRAGVLAGGWKLTRLLDSGRGGGRSLFHRATDPGDRRDLALRNRVRAGYLEALLEARLGAAEERVAGGEAVLDPETEAALRALGYVP